MASFVAAPVRQVVQAMQIRWQHLVDPSAPAQPRDRPAPGATAPLKFLHAQAQCCYLLVAEPSQFVQKPGRGVTAILRNLGGGLAASLLSLAYCFSYGAFIFSGPLQPYLAQGVSAALITAAITATLIALTSSFRFAIAGPDSNTTALLASMMVVLAPKMAAAPPEQALFLAMAALGSATLLSGVALFLLGWGHLGRLVRFVPYPVVAGFLASTGWLMLSGAVKMTVERPLAWQDLSLIAEAPTVFNLAAATVWAGALWFVTTRWKHPLMLPASLIAGIVTTHAVLALLSWQAPGAVPPASAIMFSVPAGGHPVLPWEGFARAEWGALAGVAGEMAAVAVMAILSILLNSTSIELATGVDVDLDRELRAQGFANLASAFAGGFVGHISVSRTLVNIAAGGVSRITGVVVGLVALSMLFFGSQAIAYVPRFVLGGLLLQLGARLLWDWGVRSVRSLPLLDWLVVVAIVLVTSSFGFLQALLFGMIAGCVIFAVDVSRIRVIRHQYGLDERPSSLVRSREESAFLLEHGGQVQVLELNGYLFFGSAYSVLERVTTLVTERIPQQIIFDFSGVTGIDSSAGASFTKIRELLRKSKIEQAMVAMSPLTVSILSTSAGLDRNMGRYDYLDAALEEAEETMLSTYSGGLGPRRSIVDWLTEVVGSREHAQALFDRMKPTQPDARSYLCRQGDPTDSLFLIERGPVSVTLERQGQPDLRVRAFGAHTLVGEIGFFLDIPRSANLLAGSGAIVWSLSRSAFEQFKGAYPAQALALTIYVIRLQSERLTFANRQIASLQR
jgi:SulP family sulfate permease